jgi:hypothetical protein
MAVGNLPLVAGNVARAAWNLAAKRLRALRQRLRRASKRGREARKGLRADARGMVAASRDASRHAYSGTVRASRYWGRVHARTLPKLRRELSVRGGLWRAASGSGPIVVGPWLSEVGYEVLYWVPFLRWFADHYGVPPERLVVVSRGGVASWYAGVAEHYVELLDLFEPADFAARNAARQERGEQKQHAPSAFDEEILARVRARPGLEHAPVCHPSAMFRLLRPFWLGNDSLEYLLQHMKYAAVDGVSPVVLPALPDRFTAVKFYTGVALPDTAATRRALRAIVERVAALGPVVLLDTGLRIDEHEDYLFDGIPDVVRLGPHMTPPTNLAMQTEVIRRADRFVGTCGSLAWLAPMLGTETLAVYEDDHLLTSHLYAARHAFAAMRAAPFTTLDLRASSRLPGIL